MAVIVRLAGLNVMEEEVEELMRKKNEEEINGWFVEIGVWSVEELLKGEEWLLRVGDQMENNFLW